MAGGGSKSSSMRPNRRVTSEAAAELRRDCGVDWRSQSGVRPWPQQNVHEACFLRRQDGRKQRARAEEIAGDASPNARRLFAVADASPLVQDDNAAQRGPAIQTNGHAHAASVRSAWPDR